MINKSITQNKINDTILWFTKPILGELKRLFDYRKIHYFTSFELHIVINYSCEFRPANFLSIPEYKQKHILDFYE